MEAEQAVVNNPVKMGRIRHQLEAELAAKAEKKKAKKEAKKAAKDAQRVRQLFHGSHSTQDRCLLKTRTSPK